MDREAQLKRLADPQISFVEKLRIAITVELFYWEDRVEKPNLPKLDFVRLIRQIPSNLVPQFKARDSGSGPHGTTGDDQVFTFTFQVFSLGKGKTYYVKGFFFDKGNCRGVEIQSFREEKLRLVSQIKRS